MNAGSGLEPVKAEKNRLVASWSSRNAAKSCCMCGGAGSSVASWHVKS